MSRSVFASRCRTQPKEFGGRVYCYEHQRRFTDVLRKAGEVL